MVACIITELCAGFSFVLQIYLAGTLIQLILAVYANAIIQHWILLGRHVPKHERQYAGIPAISREAPRYLFAMILTLIAPPFLLVLGFGILI